MNEQQWLSSENPAAMLAFITRHPRDPAEVAARNTSDRKLRLFACSCCRAVWHLLTDERSRRAVEVAELYADGEASEEERYAAWTGASKDYLKRAELDAKRACHADAAGAAAGNAAILDGDAAKWNRLRAALLREIVGNPFLTIQWLHQGTVVLPGPSWDGSQSLWMYRHWLTEQVLSLAQAAYEERPSSKVCDAPGCRGRGEWTDEAGDYDYCPACNRTGRIADGTLDPFRLALLADALEEAGAGDEKCPDCTEPEELWRCRQCRAILRREDCATRFGQLECGTCLNKAYVGLLEPFRPPCKTCGGAGRVPHPLLTHLRSPGPHVRGCWALDLIRSKE